MTQRQWHNNENTSLIQLPSKLQQIQIRHRLVDYLHALYMWLSTTWYLIENKAKYCTATNLSLRDIPLLQKQEICTCMQCQEKAATSLRESTLLKASSSLPSFKSLESSIVGSNDSWRCCKESSCIKQKYCQKNPTQFLHQFSSIDKPSFKASIAVRARSLTRTIQTTSWYLNPPVQNGTFIHLQDLSTNSLEQCLHLPSPRLQSA